MCLHRARRRATRTTRLHHPPTAVAPPSISLLQGVSMPPPETRGFFFQQVLA